MNPVQALMDKPAPESHEAAWLEVWEGALLLEAARTHEYDARTNRGSGGDRLRESIQSVLAHERDPTAAFLARMRAAGRLASAESLAAYLAGERIPTRDYLTAAAGVLGIPTGELVQGRRAIAPKDRPVGFMYALIGTFLLTGGRRAEVFGLGLEDVSLKRGVVTFRPNRWRRLKTKTSRRNLPLWPQLREILEPYLEERRRQGAGEDDLLFEARPGAGMLNNVSRSLDAIAGRAGWKPGDVRPKAFRHAYASARVQTLDRGHPVSDFVVAKEMGHGGFEMVRRVYGHLGQVNHRSEVVEYRIEQHGEEIPPERLRLLLHVA